MTTPNYNGKTISSYQVDSEPFRRCSFKTPGVAKLFNFRAKLGGQVYTFLDGYGDEVLPEEIVDRALGKGSFERGYVLAIREDGAVFVAHFGMYRKRHFVVLTPLYCKPVLKAYMARLGELLTAKRPFYLTLEDHFWRDLWDREVGFSDILYSVQVMLCFDKVRLCLGQASRVELREVGGVLG